MKYSEECDLAARVGITVRRLRDVKGCSQSELAGQAGVAQSAVSQIEAGKRLTNLNTLQRLASALGTSASGLLALVEAGPDKESLGALVAKTLQPSAKSRSTVVR